MATSLEEALTPLVSAAAQNAGLKVIESKAAKGFNDTPTAQFTLALAGDESKKEHLELSSAFDFARPDLQAELKTYFAESTKRLRNPKPDSYVTLTGIPLTFENWRWPFHRSTSGADTYIVHGECRLEDGKDSPLHAKVSGSMTVTFAEIVLAPEQPFSEGFIYNAVRKTMDQGQLELVKSGNRQPVPVTTRYYSSKQKKFVFNDTDEQQRQDYIAAKLYWLSGVLGDMQPVWTLDPRDAQYLNTTVEDLRKTVESLAGEGILQLSKDTEYATATAALMDHHAEYESELADALAFLKPSFNEDMRGGHTNM